MQLLATDLQRSSEVQIFLTLTALIKNCRTGVSRFQYTVFKNKTTLKIPKIKTQEKIAAILSAYDDLIENNKRRIALLEKMAEEIYREWFVRMRFPGYRKMKFEKGLPEDWRNFQA